MAIRSRADQAARAYFDLSRKTITEAIQPSGESQVIIAVGGNLATGKSTLAEGLSDATGYPVVDTDRTRKWLLGVAPLKPLHDAPWQGAYQPSQTTQVYDECMKRASIILKSGRSVILDASFRSREVREQVRQLAARHAVRLLFVECQAPAEICRNRLERRERETGVSDGRLEIFDEFSAKFRAMNELSHSEHITVDTRQPLEMLVHAVLPYAPAATSHSIDSK
jgi:predicted kinase